MLCQKQSLRKHDIEHLKEDRFFREFLWTFVAVDVVLYLWHKATQDFANSPCLHSSCQLAVELVFEVLLVSSLNFTSEELPPLPDVCLGKLKETIRFLGVSQVFDNVVTAVTLERPGWCVGYRLGVKLLVRHGRRRLAT